VLVERNGKYGTFYGCSSYPRCRYTTNSLDKLKSVEPQKAPEPPAPKTEEPDFGAIFDELAADDYDDFDFTDDIEFDAVADATPKKEITPNPQQTAYIEAPVDADIRVMAAPGSGKTASTVRRIEYLIRHGVPADDILYVTFTKSMADEGFDRIAERIPEVMTTRLSKQVCTIHAICYRILRWEGVKRNVPKEWEVKQALNEIIGGDDRKRIQGEWQYDFAQPGYKEVLYWIDLAKHNGMTEKDDFPFYARHMTHGQAEKVHNCRVRFDAWLEEQNYLTFTDMLYLVEQRLINDKAFREKYQARFTHVLVDDAQDTNQQALRVLITLSLNPGDNRVYKEWMTNRGV
jgi:DNA helicase-2/ATP-dependent DNA helicase PcrA